MSVRLWIDTDVGDNPDDAVALLLAESHPLVDLVGVSTVHGDVALRAELARNLLGTTGSDVFVYAGEPDPRALVAAEAILAIGPPTNIAHLLDIGVDLPAVAVMGGAMRPVRHRGAERAVESNFATAPQSAQRVVAEVADLLLVPLDVTARMLLSPDELDRLVTAAPILRASVERWIEHQRGSGLSDDGAAVCLHDPLALLALVGDDAVSVEPRQVVVDGSGALSVDQGSGTWIDVVVAVDRDVAVRRVLELLADHGVDATGAQIE